MTIIGLFITTAAFAVVAAVLVIMLSMCQSTANRERSYIARKEEAK